MGQLITVRNAGRAAVDCGWLVTIGTDKKLEQFYSGKSYLEDSFLERRIEIWPSPDPSQQSMVGAKSNSHQSVGSPL